METLDIAHNIPTAPELVVWMRAKEKSTRNMVGTKHTLQNSKNNNHHKHNSHNNNRHNNNKKRGKQTSGWNSGQNHHQHPTTPQTTR